MAVVDAGVDDCAENVLAALRKVPRRRGADRLERPLLVEARVVRHPGRPDDEVGLNVDDFLPAVG